MKELVILTYPNPVLRQKSEPILNWSDELTQLVTNMRYTMEVNNDAVGLSAIQVGAPIRLFLAKIDGYYKEFINPEIVEAHHDVYSVQEGCLSFPGVYDPIPRAKYVKVKYHTSPTGQFPYAATTYAVTDTYKDLDAIIIQHEIDHLNGVLMYDHVTPQYRKRIDKKLKNKK